MENMNDVNNLDPNDEGLKAVMGDRFHDATTGEPAPAKKATPVQPVEERPTRQTVKKVLPAKWAPPKPDPNWMDRLQACTKWAAIFGGMGTLFFYWQQAGLMDPAAAMPSMIACALLGGLSIGRNAVK